MEIFRTLGDATIGKLKPLRNDHKIRTLDFYSGQLDGGDLKQLALQFPGVYVTVPGLKNKKENRLNMASIGVYLLICDNNLTSNKSSRGDKYSLGLDNIMQEIYNLITDKIILPGWIPMVIKDVLPVVTNNQDSIHVWSMSYQTKGPI